MNVLILMAGLGVRTNEVSEGFPKPLIRVHDYHLIELVMMNFFKKNINFIFVVQEEHFKIFDITKIVKKYTDNSIFIQLGGQNDGALISALSARSFLDEKDLLIVNSDQFLTKNIQFLISEFKKNGCDGAIITMFADGPKWSYVEKNEEGFVVQVAEKKQISNEATIGAYWFKNGSDFISAAEEMIQANDRTNNEFYLAPVYNYLIKAGKKVITAKIEDYQIQFFGLGTAEDIIKARQDENLKNIINLMSDS